jgi:alpha-tubulin suppressor-like RCC1 family protein
MACGQSDLRVHTQPSRPIGFTSIILSGIISSEDPPTEVWFEWGAGTSFDHTTSAQSVSTSTEREIVTAVFQTFIPAQPYLYRLVASNASGVTVGGAQFINPGGHAVAAGGPNFNTGEENNLISEGFGEVAVSVGREHTILLRQDGRVVGLGKMGTATSKLAAKPPLLLADGIAVASGSEHALVLRSNGTVVAWGVPNPNFPFLGRATNVPPAATDVMAIAAGGENSLALRRDGTVVAWGGITNVPPSVTNIVTISSGWNVNVALRLDGAAVLWNNTTNYFFSTNNYVGVAAGESGGYLIQSNGRYYSVGLSTNLSLASQTNVAAIAFGQNSGALLLKYDGTISGGNSLLAGRSNIVAVAQGLNQGGFRSAVLRAQILPARAWMPVVDTVRSNSARFGGFVVPNGVDAQTWFEWGELKTSVTNSTASETVSGIRPLRFVKQNVSNLLPSTPYWCRLVISNSIGIEVSWERRFTTGAKVTVWGDANVSYDVPLHLANLVACEGGATRAIAMDASGNVLTWGYDPYAPATIPADLGEVANVGAGGWHSFALQTDGIVKVWGGRTNESLFSPTYLTNVPPEATNLVLAAGGGWHMVGLRADGTVVPWAGIRYFATPGVVGPGPSVTISNVPPTVMDIVSVSTSGDHILALRRDGRVFSWGDGIIQMNHSVPNSLLTNVVSIYGSVTFNLAVRKDGTVACWNGSQSSLVTGYTNVLAVAGGWYHHAALRRDGTVVAVSTTGSSGMAAPVDLSSVATIESGDNFLMALGVDTTYITSRGSNSRGLVNRDLVVLVSGAEANGDPTFKRVTVLPDRGQLYQFTEAGRGDAITVVGTVVNDDEGRLIFAPAPHETGKPYTSFGFLTTDGVVESAPATNTINVLPEIAVHSNATNVLAEVGFTLNFSAPTNLSCFVYYSTNLTTWILRGAATQTSPGEFRYKDTAATADPYRFYRVLFQ